MTPAATDPRPLGEFFAGRPPLAWALAGKGPSFARRGELGLARFPVLGLNHVCQLWPCELTHFTDLDAFLQCGPVLAAQAGAVAMPWHPHTNNRPGKRTLADLAGLHPPLAELISAGRLFAYNSSLAKSKRPGLPAQTVRFFSAVVGLDILAAHGVKTVWTIGVDGGAAYAPGFDTAALLSNGRRSFDVQFAEMRRVAARRKVQVRPIVEAPP